MNYEARVISDEELISWDDFVSSHPLGRGIMTSLAAPMYRINGWTLYQAGLYFSGKLVGGISLRTKKIPFSPYRVVAFDNILPHEADIRGSLDALLMFTYKFAQSHRALEIQARFNIPSNTSVCDIEYYKGVEELLALKGYENVRENGTYMIKVDLDDESLLASISSKCRRDIRKGLREGVTVKVLDKEVDYNFFCQEHHAMSERKGLTVLAAIGDDTYKSVLPLFRKGYFKLFGSFYNDRLCSMAMVDILGIPVYYWGTTTSSAFEKGTPPCGQVLHFYIMQWCREQGKQFYNLGGSPGPIPQEGHPNYTVWRFKHEFGGPYIYMIADHQYYIGWKGRWILGLGRKIGLLRK